MEKAIN